MTRILAVSGSLRAASYNTALAKACETLAPDGTSVLHTTLKGIPLYDGDLEAQDTIPPAVTALKDAIRAADGLILVTPEYNNSLPGVFKNAIDWTSRPAAEIEGLYGGRPVALMGASMGGFGTILSQSAWLPVLKTLGTRPYTGGSLFVARAQTVFDADGQLADERIRQQVTRFLEGFSRFVQG
ncbi:NADPH-dependent FMN reductase [Aureimonas frigidaquae]|uniref:Putative flavoprotein n=1 Tax=Aureimonas frigidaquae TaxID=424757 RepID=A0A0P0Z2X2_9HYPH|nr:NADPH-dependent FMN reductase [Aureimonas frigidaquae]BAT28362.1 putative flavoprotein [Aureimonas frigidaquae]